MRRQLSLLKEYVSWFDSEIENLFENRIETAKKRYPAAAEKLGFFANLHDKYIEWIAKMLDSNPNQDLVKLKDLIAKFQKALERDLRIKTDIYSYKSVEELESTINEIEDSLGLSKTKLKKVSGENVSVLYKDDRIVLLQPLDEAASCYYGKSTKWCISSTESPNKFDQYTNEDKVKFFFIIDRKAPERKFSKIAIAVYPNNSTVEFYDAGDTRMQFEQLEMLEYPAEFLDKLGEVTGVKFFWREELELKAETLVSDVMTELDKRGSIPGDFFSHYKTDSGTVKPGLMLKAVSLAPIKVLAYLASPEHGIDLKAIEDRLDVLNPSISELLAFRKASENYYGEDTWAFDASWTFLDRRAAAEGFTKEELAELKRGGAEGFVTKYRRAHFKKTGEILA